MQQSLGFIAAAPSRRRALLAPMAAALAARFEEERARWLLWIPVALGSGSALLFALPDQPTDVVAGAVAVLAMVCAAAAVRARTGSARSAQALLIAIAIACLGFALAQARIRLVAAPVLERAGAFDVEGRVIDVAPLARGARVLLDRVRLNGVAPDRTPATVRVNLRRTPPGLLPGDRIALRARLQRPMAPALPGAFDFARQAWFERLGAVGFALGTATREAAPAEARGLAVAELRARVAQRISEANPGPAGAMAAALTAGVRAGIDQATWRDMQVSGLAHILSVSGLHMAMVAGSVFVVCRWLLALVQPLALRVPVKKLAAAVALLAAAFYLVLSGASVPAQRSFLMTAVALLAVMVDRNPFSLRLLAWAAVVVLLLRPEAVVGASFQLSFAAVLALMVVYEAWRGRHERDAPEPGMLASAWRYLFGVAATTLIAGAATTPFAAFHFQTIPTYGMLANLVAVPLTTFIVMPAGMAGMLLMPLDLEGPFLHAMTLGCEAVLWIAHMVAVLPGASLLVHQWPGSALGLLALGALWTGLWQRSWRWWGLLPVAAAGVVVIMCRPPDLLIDPSMGMAAIRDTEGTVTLLEWRRDRLVRDSWLRHLGVARAIPGPVPGSGAARGIACDEFGCVVAIGGAQVALARTMSAAVEDCALTDLVIARVGPVRCRETAAIGPRQLRDSGGLAIRYRGGGLTVETVQTRRGRWPWSEL